MVSTAPLSVVGGVGASIFLIVLSIITIFISTFYYQSFSGLRSGVADVFAPILGAISKPVQDTTVFIRNITGLAELQSENLRLQKENANLRDWYQSAMILKAENQSLYELMNIKLEPQDNYITARILADSGYAFVKSLLVKAGKSDGVEKGQAVVSSNGAIGRIIETGKHTSRILLMTDINSRVPVLVENSTQHAIMAGQNGALPQLVHLPIGSKLQHGDRIITSGHGGLFPYGLPVGRIVLEGKESPEVELFTDFTRLLYVRIIDRPVDQNLRSGSIN